MLLKYNQSLNYFKKKKKELTIRLHPNDTVYLDTYLKKNTTELIY